MIKLKFNVFTGKLELVEYDESRLDLNKPFIYKYNIKKMNFTLVPNYKDNK